MKKLYLMILAIMLIGLIIMPSTAQANLLNNPDFEEGLGGWFGNTAIPGWTIWGTSGWHHTEYNHTAGSSSRAVKIWWDNSGIFQDFNVTSGMTYHFSGYCYSPATDAAKGWDGILKVEWFNDTSFLSVNEIGRFVGGTDPLNTWKKAYGSFTAPPSATKGRIVMALVSNTTWTNPHSGAIGWDDVIVEPTYYGYWETPDGPNNFGFINEGIPTNIAMGWPDYSQVPVLVNSYGYKNIILYLPEYFNNDRNNNGIRPDIEEESYWPTIFDEIADKIRGYENYITAFYLMDEPDIQAESRSTWLDTVRSSLDLDKIKFVTSGDYNGDAPKKLSDLAIFYSEGTGTNDRQKIYVATSNGLSFNDKVAWFDMPNVWFSFNYVKFAISGDFDGDGLSDIAMFYDYPDVTADPPQKVFVWTSNRSAFQDKGTWFDATKSNFDFDRIKFVNAGDYNGDGKTDIAMLYQEGAAGNYRQRIYVATSNGAGFNSKAAWFDMPPEWYHFNYVDFAVSGDFTGDGKDDVAMFYDYPSPEPDPPQKVFVWASNGINAFIDKGVWLDSKRSEFDFDKFKFVLAGERDDYNGKGLDDICMFYDYPYVGPDQFGDRPQREFVYLSGGSLENGGFIDHRAWLNEPAWSFYFFYTDFAVSGDYNGDGLDDVAMFYDYPSPEPDPPQKVFVGQSTGKGAWTNRVLLERFITACKNRFPRIATMINFTWQGAMLDKVIPRNIDWVSVDPYPFFNHIPNYPHANSWKRYDTWTNTVVGKVKKDMPDKPILMIGQSFRNDASWRIPLPEEEGWYFDTVKNSNLMGLLWFKYFDAIYGPNDGRNVYGANNYPDLLALHKKIGNEIINNVPMAQAVASSVESAGLEADKAADRNLTTRWASQFTDNEWIYLDLGYAKLFNTVLLNWEAAYGRSYKVQVSNDAVNWTDIYSTTTGDGGMDTINLTTPQTARYIRMYGTQRGTPYGYSLWEFEATYQDPSAITATASSIESLSCLAANAIDNNLSTRWASQWSDPQWIYIDFKVPKTFFKVTLNWETAYGKAYKIQISNDAVNWTDIYSTTTGDGATDIINLTPQTARYVRMYGTQRATQWGYSLWEFKVE